MSETTTLSELFEALTKARIFGLRWQAQRDTALLSRASRPNWRSIRSSTYSPREKRRRRYAVPAVQRVTDVLESGREEVSRKDAKALRFEIGIG
jgi:hypothetical protein